MPQETLRVLEKVEPDLIVDKEMQAETKIVGETIARHFPFSKRKRKEANILPFPDRDSASTSYRLLRHLGWAEVIGPILMGMSRPTQRLHPQSDDMGILNATGPAVVEGLLGPRTAGIDGGGPCSGVAAIALCGCGIAVGKGAIVLGGLQSADAVGDEP